MPKLYTAYYVGTKRRIIAEEEIPLQRAIDFLTETPNGLITDGDKEYTKEELKDAKSVRSIPGIGARDLTSGGKSVSKDSDRKLPPVTSYKAKSSSERDN